MHRLGYATLIQGRTSLPNKYVGNKFNQTIAIEIRNKMAPVGLVHPPADIVARHSLERTTYSKQVLPKLCNRKGTICAVAQVYGITIIGFTAVSKSVDKKVDVPIAELAVAQFSCRLRAERVNVKRFEFAAGPDTLFDLPFLEASSAAYVGTSSAPRIVV